MATGSELRAVRVTRGLTYRRAAALLGVSLSTLQRWEQADTISGDAVERLRNAGYQDVTSKGATYQVGRIVAIAEAMSAWERTRPDLTTVGTPAERLANAIHMIRQPANHELYETVEPTLTQIMRRIPPELPPQMTPELESAYWLGYYHQRAEPVETP